MQGDTHLLPAAEGLTPDGNEFPALEAVRPGTRVLMTLLGE